VGWDFLFAMGAECVMGIWLGVWFLGVGLLAYEFNSIKPSINLLLTLNFCAGRNNDFDCQFLGINSSQCPIS